MTKVGLFDESLLDQAEDADLNYRLVDNDYRLLFVPESFVWHQMRSSPKHWFQNMFRYGQGRARLLKRTRKMWNLKYLLPIVFILAMISMLLTPISWVFLLPIFYFPAITLYSVIVSINHSKSQLILHVALAYITEHFGYALGMIYGLSSPTIR